MDFAQLSDFVKRILVGLVIGLILMLSLHSLGVSWKSSFAMALIPMVLGSLNIFAGKIYMLSGVTMVVACVSALLFSEGERVLESEVTAKVVKKAGETYDLGKPQVVSLIDATGPKLNSLAEMVQPQFDNAVQAIGPQFDKAVQAVGPQASALATAATGALDRVAAKTPAALDKAGRTAKQAAVSTGDALKVAADKLPSNGSVNLSMSAAVRAGADAKPQMTVIAPASSSPGTRAFSLDSTRDAPSFDALTQKAPQ